MRFFLEFLAGFLIGILLWMILMFFVPSSEGAEKNTIPEKEFRELCKPHRVLVCT